MVERKIHRFHARIVALGVGDAVVAAHGMAGSHAELAFDFAQKSIKKAQVQAGAELDDFAYLIINDAAEHQRTQPALLGGAVDNLHHGMGFFGRVDKRIGGALEINAFKLIKQGFAHAL